MTYKISWDSWPSLQCRLEINSLPSVDTICFCIQKNAAEIERFTLKVKGFFSSEDQWLNEIKQELNSLDNQFEDNFHLKKNKQSVEGFDLECLGLDQWLFIQYADLILKKVEINSVDQLKVITFLKKGLLDQDYLIEKMNALLNQGEFEQAFNFALHTEKTGHVSMLFRLGVAHYNNKVYQCAYTAFSAIEPFSEDYADAQINAIKIIANTNEVKFDFYIKPAEVLATHCQNLCLSGKYLANFHNNTISIEKAVPNTLSQSYPAIALGNQSNPIKFIPLELSFSYLSSKELFISCRTINKDLRSISELTLLMRREANAVPYQRMLIKSYIMNVRRFEESPSYIREELTKSLNNPWLNYQYRLYGYFLISSLKAEFMADEAMLEWLKQNLEGKKPLPSVFTPKPRTMLKLSPFNFKASLESLIDLIPLLTPLQLNPIFPILKEKVGDEQYPSAIKKNQKVIARCLKVLASQLNDQQLTEIIPQFLKKLKYGNKAVKYEASQFVTIIKSRIFEQEVAQFCLALANKLEDMEEDVAYKVYQCLLALMPSLTDRHVYDLISEFMKQLKHQFTQVREKGYKGLSVLVPGLNDKLLAAILPLVLEQLSCHREGLNPSGSVFFTALGARLSDAQVDMLFAILSKAMDKKLLCHYTLCQFFTGLAPRLNEDQIEEISPKLLKKLNDYSWKVSHAACEALTALAPRLDQTKIEELYPKLLEHLKESKDRYGGMLNVAKCFIIVLPKVDENQLVALMDRLIQQLNDQCLDFETISEFCRVLGCTLKDTQFNDFYAKLLENLSGSDKQKGKGACLYLRAFIFRLNQPQKKELITKLIEKFDDEKQAAPPAWDILKSLEFQLNETQIESLFGNLIEQIDNKDNSNRACEQVRDLEPKLNETQVGTYFSKLMVKFECKSSYDRHLACQCIRSLIPRLNTDHIKSLIPKLLDTLYKDKAVRNTACLCLKFLIPQFTTEQKQTLHDFITQVLRQEYKDADKDYDKVRNCVLELASLPDMLNFKTYTCIRKDLFNRQTIILGSMNQLFFSSTLYVAKPNPSANAVKLSSGSLDFLKVLGKAAKVKKWLENSALHDAIISLDVNKVFELANRESVRSKDKNGKTPLALAVMSDAEDTSKVCEIISHLLNHKPSLDDLHQAISVLLQRNYAFEAIQILLVAWKMRENSKNYRVHNPHTKENMPWYSELVLLAINTAHPVETLHLLYACDADLTVADKEGNTPLHLAILQLGRGYTGYYKERFDGVMDYLLDKKVNVNASNGCGDTPLHYAAKLANLPLVKKLVEHGATIYCLNNEQKTPLDLARKGFNREELCTLLAEGEYTYRNELGCQN